MRVGDSIGPYTLERELGSGGMALVWLALNTELNRYEALKHPRLELLGNEDTQGRFEDEARLSAGLIQPNIVTIHAVGSQPHPLGMNVPYCTMELLLGGSLTALIRERKQFSIAETVAILSQAAAALDYAHARNIIHRDVKPGNMMFTEAGDARTVLKVTDFGLAKALDAGDGRTSTGHILGTPRYISPEQAGSGAPVGPGTDQYALAVLAYEMITGVTPFRPTPGASDIAVLLQHINMPPPDPRETVPDLPDVVAETLLRGLEKDPVERFPTCGSLIAALDGTYTDNKPRRPRTASTTLTSKAHPTPNTSREADAASASRLNIPEMLPTPDLRQVLADAQPGDTLQLPAGRYTWLHITKPVTLHFEPGAVLFASGPLPPVSVALPSPEDMAVIKGLRIQFEFLAQQSGPAIPAAVHLSRGNITLDGCVIEAAKAHGVWCGPFGVAFGQNYAIPKSFSGAVNLRRCRLYAPDNGAVVLFTLGDVDNESRLGVYDTLFEECRYGVVIPYRGALEADNLDARNCTGIALVLGRSSGRLGHVETEGSVYGIWDRFGVLESAVPVKSLHSGANGIPYRAGVTDWYNTVFPLLVTPDSVKELTKIGREFPGHPVFLTSGAYPAPLIVDMPLTLIADVGTEVTAARDSAAEIVLRRESDEAAGASLHGLTLQSLGTRLLRFVPGVKDAALKIGTGKLMLYDCTVTATGGPALLSNGGEIVAARCRFQSKKASGAMLSSAVSLTGDFRACTFTDCGEAGILLDGKMVRAELTKTIISGCGVGIQATNGAETVAEAGEVRSCRVGVQVSASKVILRGVAMKANRTDSVGKAVIE